MSLNIVVMAAGKGTRMKSSLPKVLHKLAGRALLKHVLGNTAALDADARIVITGHGADQVEAALAGEGVRFVRQEPQLGTGHAIQQTVPALGAGGTTLILSGDTPLISTATTRALVEACGGERLVLLTIEYADPTGYGRIVRDGEQVKAIVEHKDASDAQRAIRECYTGIMAAPTEALKRWVGQLDNNNAQGEYYLTDIVAMAVAEGVAVVGVKTADETEVLGVNSPSQLAQLERRFQLVQAESLMTAGVRLADPARFDLRGTLQCGKDVEIDVNCVFEGEVTLGDGVRVGANCVIRNATIGANARIHEFTHIDGEAAGASVGEGALIGPFARLRPGAQLGAEVHIGNFVEVKNSTLAKGAKANHLAYLGDATVGERVNYGAGSITANYDGANKFRTTIGADVHVGSNCVLVAPVTLGDGATIGGGSTITKDVAPGQLAVARGRQTVISGWSRPKKVK
ncbi:bifunctional UDP-N-acetylglucosamine diphosphorylase/glucosamine-1-phosphate N-acetyltransferase GlmU [Mitsuaria sp. GD03876]|uniref:bifunctional UDP-N-acetylglucosamine diphosphorylase/glucosamine-1-phosphate N-acetyltransferase GlmU n=1 Tax=Mitsuaria sp. GD03876 TaxID=2975399 RepID=UPI0024493927|nr:bifunctional UDP-N-acetylglucosamine diphosphorylase/glucosamine-1-phosphate N-acetyltransferase GlmU [Mitsuaria sp. GD03876]MDH0866877.1 bifunctional UDP-N-acetylglucosamine diphosphorylase/glucosamine-1-phosphate N-acetyltransferase GlmU [Mitsuaria sp. GD03876]